jgi:hypothetical protein
VNKYKGAHNAVRDAVRAGVLVRPESCSLCGQVPANGRIEGHHESYDRPLDVEWLCTRCHLTQRHGKRRSEKGPRKPKVPTPPSPSQGWWSIENVAHWLHISVATVRVWIKRHGLPHRKKGGRLYFWPAELSAWLNASHEGFRA